MNWSILIATLPGQAGSLRLRFWRQLKSVGAANLRDGVYLLPGQDGLRAPLVALRDELIAAEGNAWLLDIPGQTPEIEQAWRVLFERGEAYREWLAALLSALEKLPEISEAEARKLLRQSRKELDSIIAIDFFPQDEQQRARLALSDAEKRLARHYTPDEPEPVEGSVPRLDASGYQGRIWATRKRPWVDRVASAWLIRRFIDHQARFVWLDSPAECPPDALGFDFDGAAFTHTGEKVTFETLLSSFGLEVDPALQRIGHMVHFLDVGGIPVAEAAGVEAMLDGMRTALPDDDRLLDAACQSFDFLYQSNKNTKEPT